MNKRIKVLFVLKDLSIGGVHLKTVRLANELSKKGIEVSIASLGKADDISGEISDDVSFSYSRHFDALRGIPFVSPILSFLYGTYEVIRRARSTNSDVICAMQWVAKMPTSVAGILLRKKTVLFEVTDSIREMEQKRVKNKWHPRFVARKMVYKRASVVASNSRRLAESIAPYYNLAKVSVIYNGVDIKKIRRMSTESTNEPWFNEDIPLAVAVGKLTKRKGFEFAIEAMKMLRDEKIAVRLLIVGDGNIRRQLEQKINDEGVSSMVKIVGFKKNPYPYIAGADLFVFSSNSEGMPNVVLEAISLGIPTISTDCNYGPGEIIENEKNGILVPTANPRQLANSIKRLLQDDELRAFLSKNAVTRSWDFHFDKMVLAFRELFLKLV